MPGKKLLVADDSLTIQKVIRLALSSEGYEIQAVSEGNDAVQQIALIRPDIVLIDVSLPGKSAFEVKREVNQHSDLAEIRFVLMSSAFEKIDDTLLAEVNFHGQLTKPFDPAHLRQILADVVSQASAHRMEKTPFVTAPPSSMPPLPSSNAMPAFPETSETLPAFETSAPLVPPPPVVDPDTGEIHIPLNSEGSTGTAIMEEELKMEFTGEFSNNNEMPILPFPPAEATEQLWEGSEEPTEVRNFEALASAENLPPPPTNDIQELTRSTLKEVGIGDFQWSVQEPMIKPLPNMMDVGGATFGLNMESRVASPVPPPSISPSGASFAPPKFNLPPSSPPPMSEEMIAQLIQKQIEETLKKMAEKAIPEIAEKIIKQEIHRLLKE